MKCQAGWQNKYFKILSTNTFCHHGKGMWNIDHHYLNSDFKWQLTNSCFQISSACVLLTLSTLGKNFGKQHFELFFLIFPRKKDFDSSCKLSPVETIYMKCQILFSGKNKKNINLSSAELAQREVNINFNPIARNKEAMYSVVFFFYFLLFLFYKKKVIKKQGACYMVVFWTDHHDNLNIEVIS